MPDENLRLRALVEAGIALTSELALDAVLQRIAEAAAEITGARYAALGVIDRSGRRLEEFVTTGLDDETRARIGHVPQGKGILGVLIDDARPLLLDDLTKDPRSIGFPPNHPPMTTFLGVPIVLRGVAYGNLYLTEKPGGFDERDEELVTLLAAQAAVAVENARLYESATRWSRQLESLNEIMVGLAGELELDRLLELVAERVRGLLDCRLVVICLPSGEGFRVAAAAGDAPAALSGGLIPLDSKVGRVSARGRSERVDAVLDDPEVHAESARRFGAVTGLFAPLLARGRTLGVIGAHDKNGVDKRFTDDDLRLVDVFAARAAMAVDLSERVARDSLRRVVAGQELERRRLARELHDETGQALTSILLGLKAVEDATPETMDEAAGHLRKLVVETLQDVRRLAVELRPKALDDFGLVPALERLTETFSEGSGIKVELSEQLGPARLGEEVETMLYRIVQEALTNIVKHAAATTVSITLLRREGTVLVVIEDDGRGFREEDVRADGFGLVGMRERVALLGGRFTVESSEGAGTTVAVEVQV